MDHEPVQSGREPAVEAPQMPQLVRKDAGRILSFQETPGEHQGVTTCPGVGPLRIDHEPARGQRQGYGGLGLEMLDSVSVGELLTL